MIESPKIRSSFASIKPIIPFVTSIFEPKSSVNSRNWCLNKHSSRSSYLGSLTECCNARFVSRNQFETQISSAYFCKFGGIVDSNYGKIQESSTEGSIKCFWRARTERVDSTSFRSVETCAQIYPGRTPGLPIFFSPNYFLIFNFYCLIDYYLL